MFPPDSPFVTDLPDNDTYNSAIVNGTGEAHISSLFYSILFYYLFSSLLPVYL